MASEPGTTAPAPGDQARRQRRVVIVLGLWLGFLFGLAAADPQTLVRDRVVRGTAVSAGTTGTGEAAEQAPAAVLVALADGRTVRVDAPPGRVPMAGAEIELTERTILGIYSTHTWIAH